MNRILESDVTLCPPKLSVTMVDRWCTRQAEAPVQVTRNRASADVAAPGLVLTIGAVPVVRMQVDTVS
jgi:hypothetical protein